MACRWRPEDDLRHFLVAYRIAQGHAAVLEYAHHDYEVALDAYRAAEEAHADELGVEVVRLSADSLKSLMASLLRAVAPTRGRLRHRASR
jgi:hypothetical protein